MSKRRSVDFRLTSVAQKRLCLSSLISASDGSAAIACVCCSVVPSSAVCTMCIEPACSQWSVSGNLPQGRSWVSDLRDPGEEVARYLVSFSRGNFDLTPAHVCGPISHA